MIGSSLRAIAVVAVAVASGLSACEDDAPPRESTGAAPPADPTTPPATEPSAPPIEATTPSATPEHPSYLEARDGDVPSVARFREAVERDGRDVAALCELSFALVQSGRFDDARAAATPAIDALTGDLRDVMKRRLGACLYNRGRALEELGERANAARDYAASLAVRPNDTVLARLRELVPLTPADAPTVALALLEYESATEGLSELTIEVTTVSLGGTDWHFVAINPGGHANDPASVYVVTTQCGRLGFQELAVVHYDNANRIAVVSARAQRVGRTRAIVVEVDGRGDDNCGRMEGVFDFEHHATIVVSAGECTIDHQTFVTEHFGCDSTEAVDVRIESDGDIVFSSPRGDSPWEAGTVSFDEL